MCACVCLCLCECSVYHKISYCRVVCSIPHTLAHIYKLQPEKRPKICAALVNERNRKCCALFILGALMINLKWQTQVPLTITFISILIRTNLINFRALINSTLCH